MTYPSDSWLEDKYLDIWHASDYCPETSSNISDLERSHWNHNVTRDKSELNISCSFMQQWPPNQSQPSNNIVSSKRHTIICLVRGYHMTGRHFHSIELIYFGLNMSKYILYWATPNKVSNIKLIFLKMSTYFSPHNLGMPYYYIATGSLINDLTQLNMMIWTSCIIYELNNYS